GSAGAPGSAGGTSRPRGSLRVEGFRTPRAVLHDADADVYLVSNVNGDPAAADDDDNGFISRVTPDGKVLALRWIDGARDEALQLSAPMGMALAEGVLWVADCNRVHAFDARTGKLRKSYKLGRTASIADVVIVGGAAVVSDEGPELGPGMLYRIGASGRPVPYLRPNQRDIGRPHGLYAASDGSIWVTADRELYRVVKGERTAHGELPTGPLDGVIGLPGGELLVASHEGVIYRGTPAPAPAPGPGPGSSGASAELAVTWTAAYTGLKTPSDLGLDAGRRRLLIPLVLENAIEIRDLPPP
ncbi:MAG TPA: hypothetical protein VN253_25015, partial [Kofleriaceae bacterium]|nr:hypothetical protein [Kofleriaceae bacterium]